ncbi:MAG: hypothetical protein NTY03_11055 [Candidatus Bathyarchaeota archaeon]|nr:hypothetical protein [Candidatus Bathyarchaeota archaeon]
MSRYYRGSRLDILRAEAAGLDTDHVSDQNIEATSLLRRVEEEEPQR